MLHNVMCVEVVMPEPNHTTIYNTTELTLCNGDRVQQQQQQ